MKSSNTYNKYWNTDLTEAHQIIVILLPLFILICFFLFRSYSLPLLDFANYYYAAELFSQTTCTDDLYNAIYFNECLTELGIKNVFTAFYPNAPSIFFLYKPLLLFKPFVAKLIFNTFSVLLFFLSLYRLAKSEVIWARSYLVLPIIFFLPLKNCIYFGQPYLLMIALLIFTYLFLKEKQFVFASLALAIACLFKLTPVLLLFYLILKKQWKIFGYTSLIGVSFILITASFYGTAMWMEFVFKILPSSSDGLIFNGFDARAKSAVILFKNLFVYDQLANPSPLMNATSLFIVCFLCYKLMLLFAGIRFTFNKNNFLAYTIWLLIGILLSPNLGTYTFVLLIPLYLSLNNLSNKKFIFYSIIFILLCNFPALGIQKVNPNANYFQIILGLVLLFIFYTDFIKIKFGSIDIKWTIALGSIFIALSAANLTKENSSSQSSYLLSKDKHMLIQDYELAQDGLVYFHPSLTGTLKEKTNLQFQEYKGKQAQIIENQIFLNGQQLTNDLSNKRKAIRVTENRILFLSDENRAPGFYTLKSIEILSK